MHRSRLINAVSVALTLGLVTYGAMNISEPTRREASFNVLQPAPAQAKTAIVRAGLPESCRQGDPNPWRFMFTGDSMTDGVGQVPYWVPLMNRMPTVPRLSVGSRTNAYGVNEGIPGQTASQLNARLPGLMTNYHPNVVVLWIGTNLDGDGVNTLAQVTQSIDIVLAADPCVRLLVATTMQEYDARRSIDQQYVNTHIADVVNQRDDTGTRVRWVDTRVITFAKTIDKLHLSTSGADDVSWLMWYQLQHFVGVTVGNDRFLQMSAANYPTMPVRNGSSQ